VLQALVRRSNADPKPPAKASPEGAP
jgi:hypothetical protein